MTIMQVNTAELKTHLGRYLQMVRKGEIIDVTSHSYPVAKIMPYTENMKPGLIEPTRKIEDLKSIKGIKTEKQVDAVKSLLEDRDKR